MSETNKSVLVIDTPKNCNECKLCYHEYYITHEEIYCTVHKSGVFIEVNKDNKPEWCPLSPLPSYKEKQTYEQKEEVEGKTSKQRSFQQAAKTVRLMRDMYDSGWNGCLDAILKGEK